MTYITYTTLLATEINVLLPLFILRGIKHLIIKGFSKGTSSENWVNKMS